MTRATMSVGPPAEKETMMRTGLDGYLSLAFAPVPTRANAMTAGASAASERSCLPMTSLPDVMMYGRARPVRQAGSQSIRMLAVLMIFPHFGISALIYAA